MKKIKDLDLSVRTLNRIRILEIHSEDPVEKLCNLTVGELIKVPCLGKTAVKEIQIRLSFHNLYLKNSNFDGVNRIPDLLTYMEAQIKTIRELLDEAAPYLDKK